MVFWHAGLTLVILWFVFRGNTRLDYRWAIVGSLLPDIVDKLLGRVIFADRLASGRLWGHTLLINVAFFAVLFFMRGRRKRRLVLLPIGSLLHLAEDAMWSSPQVFWWPLFGTTFPSEHLASWWSFLNPFRHPTTFIQELIGLAALLFLFSAHRMLNRPGLATFIRTGRLEMEEPSGRPRRGFDHAEEGRDSTGQDAG